MENEASHISPLLQALLKASKHLQLQVSPVYSLLYHTDPRPAIEALLNLGADEAESDPSLSKLSQSLTDLKTLSQKLDKLQGSYTFRSLFYRHVTKYEISQTARAIEALIHSFSDRKVVENLLTKLSDDEAGAEQAVAEFRARLASRGFDRDLQELILRGRVFSALELALCGGGGDRVRDEAALAVLALAEFNRDVFVGLCLMGPTAKALVQISSLTSIRVLRALVGLIGAPMVDSIGSESEARVKIVSLLSAKDIVLALAAMDVVLEVAFMGTREVVEAVVVGEGLVGRLVELQRRMEGGDFGAAGTEAVSRSLARGSCVARLAATVEVGEGMEKRERREIRSEILRLLGECEVSEEEFVAIVADVSWG